VAFVRDGALLTPPLAAGILSGVTRRLMLQRVAASAGLSAREASVRPADFARLDECLLLSTTRDVVPVAAIDGTAFQVGPDTVTARLKAAFAVEARAYATAHPELAVV
jgi:branched-chain amino acid aminotransferase